MIDYKAINIIIIIDSIERESVCLCALLDILIEVIFADTKRGDIQICHNLIKVFFISLSLCFLCTISVLIMSLLLYLCFYSKEGGKAQSIKTIEKKSKATDTKNRRRERASQIQKKRENDRDS